MGRGHHTCASKTLLHGNPAPMCDPADHCRDGRDLPRAPILGVLGERLVALLDVRHLLDLVVDGDGGARARLDARQVVLVDAGRTADGAHRVGHGTPPCECGISLS